MPGRAQTKSGVSLVAALVALLVIACQAPASVPGIGVVGGAIPRCDTVPRITASPELYRDDPIYVMNEAPTDRVLAWAQGKPGFEQLWIDRDHLGWVTVAFSRDAAARQAELATEFPGEGVVVVAVEWTMAELEALQQRVIRDGRPHVIGSGVDVTRGVVSIMVGYLRPETVAAVEALFAGQRVCLAGLDPALAPQEGPQPQAGDGWRLLADQDEVGGPYRTGIAADQAAYEALWAEIDLAGEPPDVDFQAEVVIWFGAVHGSSCPRLRLDNVVAQDGVVFAEITSFMVGACTADAIGHAYVVAVQRSKLPVGPFTLQLEGGERPAGVIADELTIVDADLSIPGASLAPDQLHSAPPVDAEPRVEAGGVIEPEVEWRYRLWVHCGIEWLGELNGVHWRTAVPVAEPGAIPPAWRAEIEQDGTIDLTITMHMEPEPAIDAVAGGHAVRYLPNPEIGPPCR